MSVWESIGSALAPVVGIVASTYLPASVDVGLRSAVGAAASSLVFALTRGAATGAFCIPKWIRQLVPISINSGNMLILSDDMFADMSAFILDKFPHEFSSICIDADENGSPKLSLCAATLRHHAVETLFEGHRINIEIVPRADVSQQYIAPGNKRLKLLDNFSYMLDNILTKLSMTHQIRLHSATADYATMQRFVNEATTAPCNTKASLWTVHQDMMLTESQVRYSYSWRKKAQKPLEILMLEDVWDLPELRAVTDDVNMFLHRKSLFHAFAQPHRRGYLFHGPPGTGKSTFVRALAWKHRFSLRVLDLSIVQTAQQLAYLVDMIPQHEQCILLLDDLDRFVTRLTSTEDSTAARAELMSVLMSMLDGPLSAEGRITIITCNEFDTIKNLDPSGALTREGRIDVQAKFQLCSPEQIKRLITKFLHVTAPDATDKHPRVIPDSVQFASDLPVARVVSVLLRPGLTISEAANLLSVDVSK